MRYRISILAAARADEDEIARYLAIDSLDVAMRFYEAAYDTYRMIEAHPARWPKYDPDDPDIADLRRRAVLRFPNYLVFYRIQEDLVLVVAVMHGARNMLRHLKNVPRHD